MSAQLYLKSLPSIASDVPAYRVLAHILMLNPEGAERRGFEFMDGGYFSAVYRHPKAPGVVFKVSRASHNDKAYTLQSSGYANRHVLDGYAMYVSLVQEYTRRFGQYSFLPVIHMALVKPERQVYVLESLFPTAYTATPDEIDRYEQLRHYAASVLSREEGWGYDGYDGTLENDRTRMELEDFTKWLADRMRDFDLTEDLHEHNVMYRRHPDFKGWDMVITDPIAGNPRQEDGTHRYREKLARSQQLSFARN